MTSRRSALTVLVGAATLLALMVGSAFAYWTTVGSGTGSATITTINPPAAGNVTTTSASNAVTVAVNAAPSAGAPVHGYRIDRTSPSAFSGACFIEGTTGSCNAPASGSGVNTYNVISYRGTGSLQYWQSSALTGVTGTPTASMSVTGLSPATSARGVTRTGVVITGSGFVSGATISFPGSTGISASGVTFNSATSLTANIAALSTATLGARNVTVTNPGAGGTAATCNGCYTISNQPTWTSQSPNNASIPRGSSQTYTITGTGFQSGFVASAPSTSYTLTNSSFTNSTSISVTFRNDYTASGSNNSQITITNPDGGSVQTGGNPLRNP